MTKTRNSLLQPLIVGDGRLARHWKHYLDLKSLPFLEWHRGLGVSFAAFANDHAQTIGSVYVLISDAALATFFAEHRADLPIETPWFHASGALVITGMTDAHPLMTFSQDLYSLAQYEGITITSVERGDALAPLLGNLNNMMVQILAEEKARYHALCVLGAAGTGALWQWLETEYQKLGIAPPAWHPYQKQIFENLSAQGRAAITGPWVRGDKVTIEKNQNALAGSPGETLYKILKGIYDEHAKH